MKFYKLIIIFLVTLVMVSCKKDDNGDDGEEYALSAANFIGDYEQNYLQNLISETVVFSNGTTSTSTTTTLGDIFQDVIYQMQSNGIFTANGLLTTNQIIVSADGETTMNDGVIIDLELSGTYALNVPNSVLTIIYDDEEGIQVTKLYDITVYTETEMRMEYEISVTSGDITTTTFEEIRFIR